MSGGWSIGGLEMGFEVVWCVLGGYCKIVGIGRLVLNCVIDGVNGSLG